MQEDFYILLIYKQLQGTISDTEQEALTSWEEGHPENRSLADRIRTAWQQSEDYPNLPMANLDAEYASLQSRLQADTTPVRVRNLSRRRWIAIAATLLFMISFGLWSWFSPRSGLLLDSKWNEALAEDSVREVKLFDGTLVYLRPGSRLSYPSSAVANLRPVRLEGEAFFDVAENPDLPFQISTAHIEVSVLGTSFNVRAEPVESQTVVSVASGKVRLQSKSTEASLILTADQRGIYDHALAGFKKESRPNLNELAWKRGDLKFRNTKLSDVLGDVENAFDITIRLENSDLADCPLSGRYMLEKGPEDLLDNLRSFLEIKWVKKREDEFVIRGGTCPH
ncbi:MAG: DUF4974 domain-containing protein [Bacteroidetes bacterium]|nr:DUF4974 domain-containing protein [Bacteroidota bacterium]